MGVTSEDHISRRSRFRAGIAQCAIAGLLASTAMFAYAGSATQSTEGAAAAPTSHLTGQVGGTCLEAGPTTDAILAGWAQQRAGQQVEDVKVDWHG